MVKTIHKMVLDDRRLRVLELADMVGILELAVAPSKVVKYLPTMKS